MRTWMILIVLVVGAAVAGWAWTMSASGLPVEAAEVRVGEIRQFVDERAQTRLPQTYSITMPYTGRAAAVQLAEGTPVTQGETVAQLVQLDLDLSVAAAEATIARLDASIAENDDVSVESTSLKQAMKFAESMDRTVEAAKARVEAGLAKKSYAEHTMDRVRKARSGGGKTEDDYEAAQVNQVQATVDSQQDILVQRALEAMQVATALMPTAVKQYIERKTSLTKDVLAKQRAEAQVTLQQVKNNQKRGTLVSPVDGVVLNRYITDEQQLPAGTELLRIGRLDDLEIEADILSQDMVNVREGNEAEVSGAAIGKAPAHGAVRRIYPAGFSKISSLGVEQQRVKVVVALNAADSARLRKERGLGVAYRVRVRIFTDTHSQALTVPRSALFRGAAGNWQLFAVRNGKAALQAVQVGLMNDELVEITAGLKTKDTVILAPETNLTEGTAVTPFSREFAKEETARND